jgi:hypothetical protein
MKLPFQDASSETISRTLLQNYFAHSVTGFRISKGGFVCQRFYNKKLLKHQPSKRYFRADFSL